MSGRDARPPRSQRPRASQQPDPAPADSNYYVPYAQHANPDPAYPSRPPAQPVPPAFSGSSQTRVGSPSGNVSFQRNERGERADTVEHPRRPPRMPSAYAHPAGGTEAALEGGYAGGGGANVGRKKSLVRPDREKIEPGHRQWHYRTHAAQMENENRVGVMPSTTGNVPQTGRPASGLRRGKSLLAREEGDGHESGVALFPRGGSGLLRKRHGNEQAHERLPDDPPAPKSRGCLGDIPGPKDGWMIYCWFITCLIPNFLLRTCGMKTPEQQRAWREKMGLISIIAALMAVVGYVTFGFTQTVCGRPPNRFHSGQIDTGSVIIHGWDYDLSNWKHPQTSSVYFPGNASNPLFEGGWNVAGNDISFMFQRVGKNCNGIISKANNSTITGANTNPDWYFPCNVYSQHGGNAVNSTGYDQDTNCHLSSTARGQLSSIKAQGQVYYTWDEVRHGGRNLAVYESNVLDFDLLKWLDKSQINYPTFFDDLMKKNGTYNGKDLSMYFLRTDQRRMGHCLEDIITVGYIDTNTIGCVASEVVLYVSLVFIIGVVGIRFGMAVVFAWFFAGKLGNYSGETRQQRMKRMSEIENWTNDIYRPAPSQYRPTVAPAKKGNKKSFLPQTSRFTPAADVLKASRPTTTYGMLDAPPYKRATVYGGSTKGAKLTPPDSPSAFRQSRSSTSLPDVCPFPLINVVPQPPPEYEPFGYPLAHTICLVTAYSESFEGLRTTLDSLATTDYPNSHKLILVIADGMVKGAGNDLTTPEICLTMMKDLVIPADEVEPHSYVAIADGHKRHNMAKVYAGFYDYDDATVELSKQQRVPIVLVAKVGNPLEAGDAKPGNRGKRDSQIVLMAFLQKVMFDERMTTFEYEFFNSIWRVAGVSPDKYELVLCVDADTKVFPDSLSRMVACMVQDEEVMGLCGETKIANKAETWVTMIQVFEYYISHHMTKAFESMFGGVTCLPGCFSMYRIKAPKGDSGYWVPILANPDIVEHYSENVVDTLHKKNLLLLGEDRYLTTLMLKTFPRRKNMFCPSAVCKTIVPDTFTVLLSQRRRWINSTIHNLFELLLVRDLCGTFCFSMQFVVGMELGGTLVLPAAISFTLYLIIISIIPGGSNTTIPLVLLAIVLGLPGILIVITTRKMAYVGWMLVYLLSLVIWNGILPAYAFWHFDDFSWGQTRQLAGAQTKENHGDKEGEFDSSHIVMKRWAEFERERRWKNDTLSRDSTYYDRGADSPKRYSMVSSSETFQPPSRGFDSSTLDSGVPPAAPRSRYSESQRELMLPTPLSVARPQPSATSISTHTGFSRSSEDGYTPPMPSSSHQRLVSSPQTGYGYDDSYDATPAPQAYYPSNASYEGYQPARAQSPRSPAAGGHTPGVRSTASAQAYAAEQYQYQRTQPHHAATYDDRPRYSSDNEDRDRAGRRSARGSFENAATAAASAAPASPDAVRRVPRARRPTSQAPAQPSAQPQPAPQSGYSRTTSPASSNPRSARSPPPFNLPPGAAPPQNYRSQAGAGHHSGYGGRYADS